MIRSRPLAGIVLCTCHTSSTDLGTWCVLGRGGEMEGEELRYTIT